ncbi:MAG: tRNA guanosine(34) transglycosylase Tgt [Phycisphaerae bacterium]|nr:tRNA guanosine(34) transglycosylase Tgt [Phycisphaerae bacterium]
MSNNFQIFQKGDNCSARTGAVSTINGVMHTPAFMPVGTCGAVKGITPEMLKRTGAETVLANTYHMMIRPGVDTVEKIGGLHKLMSWDGPILTDSGGYQVFSLNSLIRIDDDGVEFASHVDGKKFFMDAKIATNIQNRLGADIIMCFDQCTPFPCDHEMLQRAVKRTIRWAKDCKDSHANKSQLLFGIVQGGIDKKLRQLCAAELVQMDFDGYALGGLSVGEGHDNMIKTVEFTIPFLPEDKPRYLMGVGTPADIIAAVRAGIDMFDCVIPTRCGRNALAFTDSGTLRLRNSIHIEDTTPVEPGCDCYCCQNFSRASIRHFFNVSEMLGPILLSIHNIHYYQRLMRNIRERIKDNSFIAWADREIERFRTLGLVKGPSEDKRFF